MSTTPQTRDEHVTRPGHAEGWREWDCEHCGELIEQGPSGAWWHVGSTFCRGSSRGTP